MKAQTTESEKTDTQVFSVYISIASVKENLVRSSAQFRSRSASAAYNALPCKCNISQNHVFFLDCNHHQLTVVDLPELGVTSLAGMATYQF
jgi:hypothetical protein